MVLDRLENEIKDGCLALSRWRRGDWGYVYIYDCIWGYAKGGRVFGCMVNELDLRVDTVADGRTRTLIDIEAFRPYHEGEGIKL